MGARNVKPGLRERLAAAQDGFCPACGYALPDDMSGTEVDHIIPRARGGPDAAWNRRLVHLACNRRKRAKLTDAAAELAALHGVILREPRPTSWPGSTRTPAAAGLGLLSGEPLLFGGEDEATIARYRWLVELAQSAGS
jgi:5-methylcytosine-specific restriction endonuclease McrA